MEFCAGRRQVALMPLGSISLSSRRASSLSRELRAVSVVRGVRQCIVAARHVRSDVGVFLLLVGRGIWGVKRLRRS